jgi:pyrroloquinoline quinone biosynthesis protein E
MNAQHRPYTLIAELTYKCPLRCLYCSNPVDYTRHDRELDTATWLRVFEEAEELGVVQLNLTGGEPLIRPDLELYTNLITSGIPLTEERLTRFRELGLDNVQLSIQDVRAAPSDRVAGLKSFERKLQVARWVKSLGFPLTINTVLHRDNLGRVADVIALAEELSADRLELANTQYLGWALLNRKVLMPSRDQLDRAREIALAARERLRGKMEVLFVVPDYYRDVPPACMDGWGRRFLLVSPDGLALPCHAAHEIPGLEFERVGTRPLAEIWGSPEGLGHFRSTSWMPEPCRSCDRREVDFGGCRCQAFFLTGDAAATDPVCIKAQSHGIVEAARAEQDSAAPLIYRGPRVAGSRSA